MYKYTLENRSQKHICPKCSKKRFVRYVDLITREYLSNKVGRCDREINCAYHYPPKEYFKDSEELYEPIVNKKDLKPVSKKRSSFHNDRDLRSTFEDYDRNNFVTFLKTKFHNEDVEKMIAEYHVGTASYWYNSTVFWQIDESKNIRGGKIIKYNQSGRRTQYINWVHSILIKKGNLRSFELDQCLFGLNLLNRNDNIIAIVESEKTACVMSLIYDKYLWLATGSLNGLTRKNLNVLKQRKIILYPDLGKSTVRGSPYEQWKVKCQKFQKLGFDIEISDLLEKKGSLQDRGKGYDIADYFLNSK